jgi:hypothetical protein
MQEKSDIFFFLPENLLKELSAEDRKAYDDKLDERKIRPSLNGRQADFILKALAAMNIETLSDQEKTDLKIVMGKLMIS